MADRNLSQQLRKRILLYSALWILVSSTLIASVLILELHSQMRRDAEKNLSSIARGKAAAIEEYFSRTKEIALQIASRTVLAEKLASYNRGEISSDELAELSTPKLKDAANTSRDLAGLTRFNNRGITVAQIGIPLPEQFLSMLDRNADGLVIYQPITVDGEPFLPVSTPITFRESGRVGVDLSLFRLSKVREIVDSFTGLGQSGEVALSLQAGGKILSVFASGQPRALSGSIPEESSLVKASLREKRESGIISASDREGHPELIAYAPVGDSSWTVAVRMHKDEVYRAATERAVAVGLLIAFMVGGGTLGMVLVLRPLTGKMIIQNHELQHEIDLKTKALRMELVERRKIGDDLRESELRFRLLSDTASRLLAADNPQGLVNELCRKVMEHLDCQAFFNFLVDERAGKLHLNACSGIPDEEARKIEWLDFGVAVCGCAAEQKERIVAEDIFHIPDTRTELVKSFGIQAYAAHPLIVKGKLIGTLSFGTKTRCSFSPEDLALMRTVADQVATAMDRMRLIEELRASRDELDLRVQERTSELEAALKKLQESNQALQDFASIASHDMQEPLRKVSSFGNRLKEKHGNSLGQEGADYLDRMLNATDRMQALLKSLLDYSRVSTRAEPFRAVDLGTIVREVLSDLEVRVSKTGAQVIVDSLPVVEADPTQMRQLFQNLLANALKFHREGEKPVVRVRCIQGSPGSLEICVEDNGIGFEEKYLERIFHPFQRLHGTNSPYKGTGMGLAICKKIVERHGGSITANSQPEQGSRFIITLPGKQG